MHPDPVEMSMESVTNSVDDPGFVLVTLSPVFAAAVRDDPVWRTRRDGRRRRLLLLPEQPFGWIDRPPSLNRLLACAWLADPAGSQATLAGLSRRLYGVEPTGMAMPQWVP